MFGFGIAFQIIGLSVQNLDSIWISDQKLDVIFGQVTENDLQKIQFLNAIWLTDGE